MNASALLRTAEKSQETLPETVFFGDSSRPELYIDDVFFVALPPPLSLNGGPCT